MNRELNHQHEPNPLDGNRGPLQKALRSVQAFAEENSKKNTPITGKQYLKTNPAKKLETPRRLCSQPLTLQIAQWNCRSLSFEKLQYMLSFGSDIYAIQEIWNPKNLIQPGMSSKLRENAYGGGTSIIFKNPTFKLHKTVSINEDCELHRYLMDRDKILWLGSIYLSKGSPNQIKTLFQKIYKEIPPSEWKFIILAGDFNINLNENSSKKKLLETLTKQFTLKIVKSTSTSRMIDFLIHGSAIDVNFLTSNLSPSDHEILLYDISIPCPDTRPSIKLPNRQLAEEITRKSWICASNTKEFLEINRRMRATFADKLTKVIKRKNYRKPAIQELLDADENCDAMKVIQNYYNDFHRGIEDTRFSNMSKKFFQYLKKVFKYDLIDKRDGSIISSIKDEIDERIISNPKEVNTQLIKTIKELQVDLLKPQPRNLEFPNLKPYSIDEMKVILTKLNNGKAITWDGITDSIFQKERKERSAKIFADILTNLNHIPNFHFESRLIPLNKIHPKIPSRTDMRPIIVTSALLKLIEACLMPELTSYMVQNLHHSQTGFVPGNGIFVNIHRALNRIMTRTTLKKRCYGIFIDFSSAYNTVDHQLLFQKLLPILGEEKTNIIKALYSRNTIRLGEVTVTPNMGVAQGSLISPALFNIYMESLFQELQLKLGLEEEDLLGYADDILIIVDDLGKAQNVIRLLKAWSASQNMKLNAKKSGIVEFINRRSKPKLIGQEFCDLPICKEYKYLGLRLTNKLSLQNQLSFIKYKSTELHRRLSPFLHNAELDTKKNLWQVFIQPLIEFILPLCKWEKGKTILQKAGTIIRGTFKLFTGLCKNTSNTIVDTLSGYNFQERAVLTSEIANLKWVSRKNGETLNYESLNPALKQKLCDSHQNICKSMPNVLVKYLNITNSMCVSCGVPNTFKHLKTKHNVEVPNLEELLEQTISIQRQKVPRKIKLGILTEMIVPHLNRIKYHLLNLKNDQLQIIILNY